MPIGCAFTRIRSKLTIIDGAGGRTRTGTVARRILSAVRLPFRHTGKLLSYYSNFFGFLQALFSLFKNHLKNPCRGSNRPLHKYIYKFFVFDMQKIPCNHLRKRV